MYEYSVACGIGRLRNSCFFVFGTDVDKIRSLAISVKYHRYNSKINRLNGLLRCVERFSQSSGK